MAVTDPRLAQASVKRYAVFIAIQQAGQAGAAGGTSEKRYVQSDYDIVRYDWGNGEVYTYRQPNSLGRGLSRALDQNVYDGVRFYDVAPVWDPTGGSRQ